MLTAKMRKKRRREIGSSLSEADIELLSHSLYEGHCTLISAKQRKNQYSHGLTDEYRRCFLVHCNKRRIQVIPSSRDRICFEERRLLVAYFWIKLVSANCKKEEAEHIHLVRFALVWQKDLLVACIVAAFLVM